MTPEQINLLVRTAIVPGWSAIFSGDQETLAWLKEYKYLETDDKLTLRGWDEVKKFAQKGYEDKETVLSNMVLAMEPEPLSKPLPGSLTIQSLANRVATLERNEMRDSILKMAEIAANPLFKVNYTEIIRDDIPAKKEDTFIEQTPQDKSIIAIIDRLHTLEQHCYADKQDGAKEKKEIEPGFYRYKPKDNPEDIQIIQVYKGTDKLKYQYLTGSCRDTFDIIMKYSIFDVDVDITPIKWVDA